MNDASVPEGQTMADQQLPRREREKMRQREEILATALDLFSQKGYHNVAMHEIAEKAEFAIGTLYKFFQNKEDLYKTIVLERCDDFEAACRQILEQSDDEVEKLRHYVRFRSDRFRNKVNAFFENALPVDYVSCVAARKKYFCSWRNSANLFVNNPAVLLRHAHVCYDKLNVILVR
jgi:AcrR family transcriptional regulator